MCKSCVCVCVCVGLGDGEDKLSAALVDGSLQVRVRLGGGSLDVQLTSPRSNVRYDDGQWHRLVVSRHAREVRFTLDVCTVREYRAHSRPFPPIPNCDIDCSRFFTVTPNETTRGHAYKLFVHHSRVDIRKHLFVIG